MKSFIRDLPKPVEFCLVVLVCFGLSIFAAIRGAIGHLMHVAKPYPLSDHAALWLVSYEIAAFLIVLWIARVRGWSVATFGLRVSWKETAVGLLLLIAVLVAMTFQNLIFYFVNPPTERIEQFSNAGLTLPFVILVSVINPIFEELIEVGYFVHALKGFGIWPAILASACFRTLLHAYAGFNLAAGVLLLGLIFGSVYIWRRQLWPLVMAHAIIDFIGLYRLWHAG